ncbi:ATPase V1 complex subunit H [Dichotomocladium elegans]|nr:ATPase V1 complex subunit H [Dichotomocladium elegans]
MTDNVPEVPIALVTNAYLEKKAAQIKQKSMLWEGYERANLLTHNQVELIKAIDKRSPEQVQSAVQTNGTAYASLILHLVQKLSRPDTIQYVCVLSDTILSVDDSYARFFHEVASEDSSYPYGPFIKAMHLNDEFTALQASKILTILACSSPRPGAVDLTELWQWIVRQLGSQQTEFVDLAVQEIESLLRVRQFRLPFYAVPGAVQGLVKILDRPTVSPQMQYQVIFCMWLLSFEPEIAAKINKQYDLVLKITDIAKAAVKEKVIRVSIATLRNLVEKAPAENLAAMLVAKLLPFTENLSSRKWSDPDILEDIDFVKEKLQENFQSLSTFEQYASEIETGKLEWSPPHKSETFWKENASNLDEHNYQLLRALARILSTSTNAVVLAVAANDIGQYSKYGSKAGKRILQDIGAKHRVMELMTHEDQDVRYQALAATQKYMHQAW